MVSIYFTKLLQNIILFSVKNLSFYNLTCLPLVVLVVFGDTDLNDKCTGEVYTWGDNDEGQLGDGTTNAIQRPRLVAALQGKKINRVACGSAHTLAWSTSKPTNAGKLPAQVRHNHFIAQPLQPVLHI